MRVKALVLVVGCALAYAQVASADSVITVDPNSGDYSTYMNVSELPSNGGGYDFGTPWGLADLSATFSPSSITLGAADTPGDNTTYWYLPSGMPGATGNKQMDANLYIEVDNGSLSGQNVTFNGTVLSNTLVSGYTSVAFIKDFTSGFSLISSITAPLTPGPFSISLATDATPGDVVQYGFETMGAVVYPGDNPTKGTAVVAVPEPASLSLLCFGLVGVGFAAWRRR